MAKIEAVLALLKRLMGPVPPLVQGVFWAILSGLLLGLGAAVVLRLILAVLSGHGLTILTS